MERLALEEMRVIEDMGGSVTAIEGGYMQRQIADASYRWQREVEEGKRVIVGVNQFTEGEARPTAIFRPDPQAVKEQRRSLEAVKLERDSVKVQERLVALERAALGSENVMPYLLEAVKAYATIGEVCDLLRRVWGEYVAPATV